MLRDRGARRPPEKRQRIRGVLNLSGQAVLGGAVRSDDTTHWRTPVKLEEEEAPHGEMQVENGRVTVVSIQNNRPAVGPRPRRRADSRHPSQGAPLGSSLAMKECLRCKDNR